MLCALRCLAGCLHDVPWARRPGKLFMNNRMLRPLGRPLKQAQTGLSAVMQYLKGPLHP